MTAQMQQLTTALLLANQGGQEGAHLYQQSQIDLSNCFPLSRRWLA
jgi:hypothetical protein